MREPTIAGDATARRLRWLALGYALVLGAVASLNQIPGINDAQGRAFGVFALDMYDDLLHLASAMWAGFAAARSAPATLIFLRSFGALYFADGAMGLALGSGFLDLGIVLNGVVELPLGFKLLANGPHLSLGGLALLAGFWPRSASPDAKRSP